MDGVVTQFTKLPVPPPPSHPYDQRLNRVLAITFPLIDTALAIG